MFRTSVILAIGMAGALAAGAAVAQSGKADKASQDFIKSAIEGNYAEIDVGKLAQEKGKSDAVKRYGAMLVKEHGAANEKARQVASQLGVTPPTGSAVSHKAGYLKLKMLSGDTFDSTFATDMVEDHQHDIKEYEKQAQKNDPAGALAKETLPKLQEHLKQAQSLVKQTEQKQTSR